MATESKFSDKVLFVDDHGEMRKLLVDLARRDGIEEVEVFEDAESAVAKLEGLEETVAAIFSDGLNGGWEQVVAAAKKARVPAVVLSNAPLQDAAEAAGAVFISKMDLRLGVIAATLTGLQPPAEA